MKNLLTVKKDANKGITLIALIITIIVLLILTGVTIATLTGENGILTQAKSAKKEITKAEAKERIQLEVLGSYSTDGEIDIATLKANIAKNIPEAVIGEETELPLTVTVGDYTFKVKENGKVEEVTSGEVKPPSGDEILTVAPTTAKVTKNTKYQDASSGNKIAVIPAGFAVVPGCTTIDKGLVISDVENDTTDAGNQFVWIPVTEENSFERRAGYKNGSLQNISSYGEADSTGTNPKVTETSTTQAEAIAMYASVASNGGFYIGRYEAGVEGVEYAGSTESESGSASGTGSGIRGTLVTKKGAYVYNNIVWNDSGDIIDETGGAVELARNFAEENDYDTTKVHSTLCYGVQWDTALNFIDPGYKGYAKDSTKMGWYSNNYNSTDTGNTESNPENITGKDLIYTSEVGTVPAGEPTNMHKNIYDMAGNVFEWTMESYSTGNRAFRGGNFSNAGTYNAASFRGDYNPSYADSYIGFRLALYVE